MVVDIRPTHTLSVPHKMISESPACLNCPNGVRGSFAGPLVKSTYVKLTGNALLVEVQPLTHRKSASRKLTTTAYRIRRYCHRSVSASYPQENAECAGTRTFGIFLWITRAYGPVTISPNSVCRGGQLPRSRLPVSQGL